MAGLRGFLRRCSTPLSISGWRGVPFLGIALAIVIALPQARALITAGILGGIVLGIFLILIRHQAGPPRPRRGTPIVLFPRPARPATDLATGHFFGASFRTLPLGLSVAR